MKFTALPDTESPLHIYLPDNGKTLRDEFAMAVINGYFSSSKDIITGNTKELLAQAAYEVADAMLVAREEK